MESYCTYRGWLEKNYNILSRKTVKMSAAYPLISVIMNCYNGEKYLHEAINSVCAQTYKNWELIFFDNLSTDGSVDIFNKYKDERLKYYHSNKHTNLSAARVLAIDKSKGDIITFLDVDDYWSDNILEVQRSIYKDDNVTFSCGNFYLVMENYKQKKIFRRGRIPSGYVLNELLKNYPVGLLTLSVRRSAYFNSGGFSPNYHIIGDFDLAIRLAINGKMGSFQKPLAFCRKHDANESLNSDLHLRELREWSKNNSYFFKNTNRKAIDIFNASIVYSEQVNRINNNSFSFVLFLNTLKAQSVKNIIKITVKFFLKRINKREGR
jgi:glycosyltransferase involved in cell wall biosynthesis